MDFSLGTDYADFTPYPRREPTMHSPSRTIAPSATHHSPKMALPLKETASTGNQLSLSLKPKGLSTTTASTEITPPATPSEDSSTLLLPSELTSYEVMFKESIFARKNPGRRGSTPLRRLERVPMSRNDFHKLDEALGGMESDFRYFVSRGSR